MSLKSMKEALLSVIHTALEETDPYRVVVECISYDRERRSLSVMDQELQLEEDQGIYVVGSGKASSAMAQALEKVLGSAILDGLIIIPPGTARELEFVQMLEGSHPLPDKNSLASTFELIDFAKKIPDGSLVFYLLSGGSSALLCMPSGELEIGEVASTHQLLLNSGADIHEINVVRTALSRVKGGQLLSHLAHTDLVDLIISDVPGDSFRSIGSGPTSPAYIDYEQAFHILKKYKIWNRIPHEVRLFIASEMDAKGLREIEPHPGLHLQFLISSAHKLAVRVGRHFSDKGLETDVRTPAYSDPIEEVELMLVTIIGAALKRYRSEAARLAGGGSEAGADVGPDQGKPEASPPRCYIWFGESTVSVTGAGKGGRNQELALRIARHLKPGDPVVMASIGTDGVDGPTDAAGAVITAETIHSAEEQGLDPDSYLRNNDSYTFFDQTGELIKTGPTGNNLMDLQVVLIGDYP